VIRVVVDDLASLPADALVRPATTSLDPTAAALRRVETMGGAEFQSRRRLTRDLAVGAAVVTAAGGDLSAEFVIHAVIRSETEPVTRGSVARAWLSALHQAQEWEFTHLSVPPLGTGAGNLPLEDAAEIMATVLHAHLGNARFPADVSFVVETPEEREVFEAVLRRNAATGEA
jgi:O-acetyl-ADP-ribose deacetylase (regulator of RNase III)